MVEHDQTQLFLLKKEVFDRHQARPFLSFGHAFPISFLYEQAFGQTKEKERQKSVRLLVEKKRNMRPKGKIDGSQRFL